MQIKKMICHEVIGETATDTLKRGKQPCFNFLNKVTKEGKTFQVRYTISKVSSNQNEIS